MNWTLYLIQANIYLLVFYGLYRFVLANETYFKLNRTYLLLSGILAMAIPFIRLEWFAQQPASQQMNINWANLDMLLLVQPVPERAPELQWGNMVAMIYVLGILVFTAIFLFKLFGVLRILAKRHQQVAFSFFKYKRIDATLPQGEVIDRHEDVHIKQWHSADVLFFELLGVFAWFNPIIYLYKKEIKNVHEYLADEVAAAHQGDKQNYAMLLLHQAMGIENHPLTNTFFNQSTTKKRIAMLFKNRSRKVAVLKYGLAFPLLALALMLSSSTLNKNEKLNEIAKQIPLEQTATMPEVKEIISNPIAAITKKAKELKQTRTLRADTDSVKRTYNFMTMENPPSYPGGMAAFYKYIADSLRYPKDAIENNITGKVFISFVVGKDGSVNNVAVKRSLSPSTDQEAMRVISKSPKWIPGTQNGKPVNVLYQMPLSFTTSKSQTGMILRDKSKALYVVDGQVVDSVQMTKTISPSAIAHINVLKDASAVAKYGEKAKDGVIEIYTKKYVEAHPESKAVQGYPTKGVPLKGKVSGTEIKGATKIIIESNAKELKGAPVDGKVLKGKVQGVEIAPSKTPAEKSSQLLAPLYVVDGNPISDKNFDPKSIMPSEIESIEVLKDKAATALYGEKGKNGVILIITKKKKN